VPPPSDVVYIRPPLAKHNKINKSKTVVNDQNEKDKSPKVSEISVVSTVTTKAPRQLPPLVSKEIQQKRKHYLYNV
jgi:hypothetical protein